MCRNLLWKTDRFSNDGSALADEITAAVAN